MAMNNLVLGGAAVGFMAGDPIDSPISSIAGIGLGALVGSSIEIVKSNRAERAPRGAADIAVDPYKLNSKANRASQKSNTQKRFSVKPNDTMQ